MLLAGKLPRWLIVWAIGILGLALIIVPHVREWRWDYGVLPEIGIAFLVAALLAGTIDRWFKADFAKDAFEAAVGHILEPELRQELHWIAGFKWLSVKTRIRVHVEDLGNAVKITCDIERQLKNISSHPEAMRGIISIDDWGIDGFKSEVLACGAIGPDGVKRDGLKAETGRDRATTVRTEEITAQPGEIVKTFSRSAEYQHRNDVFFLCLTGLLRTQN